MFNKKIIFILIIVIILIIVGIILWFVFSVPRVGLSVSPQEPTEKIQEDRIEINLGKEEFSAEEIEQIQDDVITSLPTDIVEQLQGVSPEDIPAKLKELNIIKIVK